MEDIEVFSTISGQRQKHRSQHKAKNSKFVDDHCEDGKKLLLKRLDILRILTCSAESVKLVRTLFPENRV
ncbi:hypothetical protein CISIN_1g036496mg [Citrus sinensis]|uniref:Uncharacterized protein n=1 Tax=Citrus sinensis TaxID=2711 RepID=A0A067DKY5_CITSI|nr:hypothetical protein CISIN_1g036496mg [Citrus sinensis]